MQKEKNTRLLVYKEANERRAKVQMVHLQEMQQEKESGLVESAALSHYIHYKVTTLVDIGVFLFFSGFGFGPHSSTRLLP